MAGLPSRTSNTWPESPASLRCSPSRRSTRARCRPGRRRSRSGTESASGVELSIRCHVTVAGSDASALCVTKMRPAEVAAHSVPWSAPSRASHEIEAAGAVVRARTPCPSGHRVGCTHAAVRVVAVRAAQRPVVAAAGLAAGRPRTPDSSPRRRRCPGSCPEGLRREGRRRRPTSARRASRPGRSGARRNRVRIADLRPVEANGSPLFTSGAEVMTHFSGSPFRKFESLNPPVNPLKRQVGFVPS